MIDLRTRCATIGNVDLLRPAAEEFLSKALKTDAALLFPPSIIAISACLVAASANGQSMDNYVLEKLFADQPENALDNFKSQVKKLRSLVKKCDKDPPTMELIGQLKSKLEKCRNPETTEEKLLVFVDDEDEHNQIAVETISAD